MKTIHQNQPRDTRYKKATSVYNEVREQILKASGMDEGSYYCFEFELGLELLRSFYKDMDQEKVELYKTQLLTDHDIAFWPWFRVGRAQMECQWWRGYRFKHEIHSGVFSSPEAKIKLVESWKRNHFHWINSKSTHDRLWQWLSINQKIKL